MSTRKRIPLSDLKVTTQTIREVTGTLRSGWLSTGPKVNRFEKEIARRSSVKYAVAVNSATAGLTVALKAAGVGPGREVVTSPLTFVATIEAILYCGAKPVLSDIDPRTLNIDPKSVAKLITGKTAAIVPVDIAGHPCDYDALRKAVSRKRIPIVSDAAHAFGALYHRRPIPHWVDGAVHSFYATKNLTCGEGGMVVSDNRAYMEQVRYLSRHGMSSNAFQRQRSGGWEYDVVDLGFKANMSDLHASVGLGQLKSFAADQAKRRAIVERYGRNLGYLGEFIELPKEAAGCQSAWHLYIIKLNTERLTINRNRFIALMGEQGIECGVHYKPVYEFSHYRGMAKWKGRCPNVAAVAPRLVTLPLYAGLPLADVDMICDRVAGIVAHHTR